MLKLMRNGSLGSYLSTERWHMLGWLMQDSEEKVSACRGLELARAPIPTAKPKPPNPNPPTKPPTQPPTQTAKPKLAKPNRQTQPHLVLG